jgi:hypothetical protein
MRASSASWVDPWLNLQLNSADSMHRGPKAIIKVLSSDLQCRFFHEQYPGPLFLEAVKNSHWLMHITVSISNRLLFGGFLSFILNSYILSFLGHIYKLTLCL